MTGLPIFYILGSGLHPVLQFKRVLLPSSKIKGTLLLAWKKKKNSRRGKQQEQLQTQGVGGSAIKISIVSQQNLEIYVLELPMFLRVLSVSQESDHQIWNPGDRAQVNTEWGHSLHAGSKALLQKSQLFPEQIFALYMMNLVLLWWYYILTVSSFFTSCQSWILKVHWTQCKYVFHIMVFIVSAYLQFYHFCANMAFPWLAVLIVE